MTPLQTSIGSAGIERIILPSLRSGIVELIACRPRQALTSPVRQTDPKPVVGPLSKLAGALQSDALSVIGCARWRWVVDLQLQTFKTKAFARFAKREGVQDAALREAVERAEKGLVDADLGGGVIKQRIAKPGGGRSSGFRTIVLFRRGTLAFFVYGFAKGDRDNLRPDELAAFRLLADQYLALDHPGLKAAQSVGAIIEVKRNGEAVQE